MFDFLNKLWYLWILIALAALYQIFEPKIKGWLGEKTISTYLRTLSHENYTVLNDVHLPTDNWTTQIDHIVVSLYGVFVIETKNYKGWILGRENSSQWTQNIYGKKSSFMNPLRQNYAHVKAVEVRISQYTSLPIIPIVAFSSACDLKVKTTNHVVYFHKVCVVIREYKEKFINKHDVESIVALLQDENIKSKEKKKEHVNFVHSKKTEFDYAVANENVLNVVTTLKNAMANTESFSVAQIFLNADLRIKLNQTLLPNNQLYLCVNNCITYHL